MNQGIILVVDDIEVNREILKNTFQEEYEIAEAADGVTAWEYIQKKQDISLILLDIHMPEMGGFELLEKIKNDYRFSRIPVVMVTQFSEFDYAVKALRLGADDYIIKPFKIDEVKSCVANVLTKHKYKVEVQYVEQDPITGLCTRNSFREEVYALLKRTSNEEKYVIVRLDVDGFKVINDLYGIIYGDHVLQEVGAELKKFCGEDAVCGRFERDIFVACVPEKLLDIKQLLEHLQNVSGRLKMHYELSLHAGIYEIHDRDVPVEHMCDRANLALQTIKGSYLNHYAYYNDQMREQILEEQEIISEMESALVNEEFCIYLQPIYSVDTGKPISAEALVRWIHPKKGMIPPDSFIPIFEKNGFIVQLDKYVWNRTCAYIGQRVHNNQPIVPISVNVSRMNLHNPRMCEEILEITKKYDIEPSMLKLEITESAYMDNPQQLLNAISKLQSYGFLVLMDDFGSVYSSLNMLKDMPVDVLKIDMRFLSDLGQSARTAHILTSIVRMAQWIDMDVIAEGVETRLQLDFLRRLGCQSVQGSYYSRPLPIEEFEKKIDEADNGEWMKNDISPKQSKTIIDEIIHQEELKNKETYNEVSMEVLSANFSGGIMGGYVEPGFPIYCINDGMLQYLGYASKDEFIKDIDGMITNCMHPDDRAYVDAQVDEQLKNNDYYHVEYRMKKKDNSYIWVYDYGRTIIAENGKAAIISACLDITDQKKMIVSLQEQNEQLEFLNKSLPGGVHKCAMDEDFTLLDCNKGFEDLLGYTFEEIKKEKHGKFIELVHPDDQEAVRNGTCAVPMGNLITLQYRMCTKDGGVIWVADQTAQMHQDEIPYYYGIVLNITDLKLAQQELTVSNERFRLAFQQSDSIIFDYDIMNKEMKYFINDKEGNNTVQEIENYLEYIKESNILDGEYKILFDEIIQKGKKEKISGKLEYKADFHGEGPNWYEMCYQNLLDQNGNPIRMVGISKCIEKEKEAEIDRVSKVYNRAAVEDKITEYLKKGVQDYAFFMIDVDGFKAVNDQYGHQNGDQLIEEIAEILQKNFRKSDIVGRIGGDEFGVLMMEVMSEEIIADKARHILEHAMEIADKHNWNLQTSVSIGISTSLGESKGFEKMYNDADKALYQAKENGRNRYQFAEE